MVNENNSKSRDLSKINTSRIEPPEIHIDTNKNIYVRDITRNKINPIYQQPEPLLNDLEKIITDKEAFHKKIIKPTREIINKKSLHITLRKHTFIKYIESSQYEQYLSQIQKVLIIFLNTKEQSGTSTFYEFNKSTPNLATLKNHIQDSIQQAYLKVYNLKPQFNRQKRAYSILSEELKTGFSVLLQTKTARDTIKLLQP